MHVEDVLPPAFYPVSLNLAGRKCVVIGAAGDREAVEKEQALRDVGGAVTWLQNVDEVRDEDVADAFFVVSTPQDEALSARLRRLADRHKFLLCAIDQPKYGFVAMQAIVKAGPARVAISTGGVSPRVGGIMKAALQAALDATFARFMECLRAQRRRNRARYPAAADRREAMLRAADGFGITVDVTYPAWFREELEGFGPRVVP